MGGNVSRWVGLGPDAEVTSYSLIFSNVSNIDHRLRNSEAFAGSITAPPSATFGDRVGNAPAQRSEGIMPALLQFLTAIERLGCSRSQTRMKLERVSPGPIDFEHRLFECPKWDHVEIDVIASDPFSMHCLRFSAPDLARPHRSRWPASCRSGQISSN
jgi:hypothetical protein